MPEAMNHPNRFLQIAEKKRHCFPHLENLKLNDPEMYFHTVLQVVSLSC